MVTLVITRGLPGSGKTTFARTWVAEDRARRARVNRDDIRKMLDDGVFLRNVTEDRVLVVRDAAVTSLLESGISVVCDDTNLPEETVNILHGLAHDAGAGFRVEDFRNIPLKTCLIRNSLRTDKAPIPEEDIRRMHALYIKGEYR